MSLRTRFALFFFSLGALGVLYTAAVLDLPRVGHGVGVYAATLLDIAVEETHATDVVTAVTFGYRAIDTLGEELILFAAVIGVSVIMRRHSDERDATERELEQPLMVRPASSESDAVRVLTAALAGISVTFGLYLATHGQVSPGGGFQGGIVLASVPLLVYLAASPERYFRLAPAALHERGEALGILAYLGIGLAGALFGQAFFENVFPLGPRPSSVVSSGMILLLSLATAIAVATAFVYLLTSFVEEALRQRLAR